MQVLLLLLLFCAYSEVLFLVLLMGFSVFFGILFIFVISCAILVVNILNPVHSVFFLTLTFLIGSIYFFFIRNEFIAIIFLIVYIGAIAVLFLFVIMLLDVKVIELKSSTISYVPLSFLFLILFFFQFLFFYKNFDLFLLFYNINEPYINWLVYYNLKITNVHIIGLFLYTYYFLIFIFCGFLLFIATMGAILLTFISLKSTSNVFDSRYEILSYYYFVDYLKLIKLN